LKNCTTASLRAPAPSVANQSLYSVASTDPTEAAAAAAALKSKKKKNQAKKQKTEEETRRQRAMTLGGVSRLGQVLLHRKLLRTGPAGVDDVLVDATDMFATLLDFLPCADLLRVTCGLWKELLVDRLIHLYTKGASRAARTLAPSTPCSWSRN